MKVVEEFDRNAEAYRKGFNRYGITVSLCEHRGSVGFRFANADYGIKVLWSLSRGYMIVLKSLNSMEVDETFCLGSFQDVVSNMVTIFQDGWKAK